YRPTGKLWVASSINGRLPRVRVGVDKKGKDKWISASRFLDRTAPVEQMTWAPGEPELIRNQLLIEGGWIHKLGATAYNLYRPPSIVSRPGDASPWLDHIKLLYPGDAAHIVSWLAHKVQRPAEKTNHALVLGGGQGIGKDTILEPVKQA